MANRCRVVVTKAPFGFRAAQDDDTVLDGAGNSLISDSIHALRNCTCEISYDGSNRPTLLTMIEPATSTIQRTEAWDYDGIGNIFKITSKLFGKDGLLDETVVGTVSYNGLNQVVKIQFAVA